MCTALEAIKEAKARGFRVTTNTTVFDGHPPEDLHKFFDDMMAVGIDGMMISPGYSYEKAPRQDKFLKREKTKQLFREILGPRREKRGKKWDFNLSPLFLEFLEGKHEYQCTPWGCPNYNVFGWQRPCYLFSEDATRPPSSCGNQERYGVGRHASAKIAWSIAASAHGRAGQRLFPAKMFGSFKRRCFKQYGPILLK